MNWEMYVKEHSWPILKHCPNMALQRITKANKHLSWQPTFGPRIAPSSETRQDL